MNLPAKVHSVIPSCVNESLQQRFRTIIVEDRRLRVLQILEEMPGCLCNVESLQKLLELFGHVASRDVIRADMVWLDEQGLAQVFRERKWFTLKLIERGFEVADGRADHPGVARPTPD